MTVDFLTFEAPREIPDAFFVSGANQDGKHGNTPYIDCSRMVADVDKHGMCRGILIGSASDAAVTATIRCRFVGSAQRVLLRLSVGVEHRLKLAEIYGNEGTARETFLLY